MKSSVNARFNYERCPPSDSTRRWDSLSLRMESTAKNGPEHQTQASEGLGTSPANGSAGPAQDADNKFQKAISAWRSIDLANLVPTLDSTASDLVAHQRDALVERKELAQKTKDFRKLEDSAKLAETKSLLKGESMLFFMQMVVAKIGFQRTKLTST